MAMKRFFLEAIVKPWAAILFFLCFGLPGVFIGFQSVDLQGHRELEGKATFIITRKHFFGLVRNEQTVANVEKASITSFEGGQGGGADRRIVSSVVLVAANEEFPVFFSASNVDDGLKERLAAEVNAFVNDEEQTEYTGRFEMRNVFGWVGLPFAAIGLFGMFRWPYTIVTKWQEQKQDPVRSEE